MLADIIIIAIIVLFIIIGIRRGLARTILNVLGIFITYICAGWASEILARILYNSFLKETVVNNINEFITVNGVDYAVSNCFSALPDWAYSIVSAVVSLFGGSFDQFERGILSSTTEAVTGASSAIEATVESVVVAVFGIILLIVLFILILILVKKLIKLVLKVFDAPVLKQVNRFFGGILGAIEGLLCAWIAVNVFYVIAMLTAPELLSNSLVCGALYEFFCIA